MSESKAFTLNAMQQEQKPVCTTCGTQFAAGQHPQELCPVCNDDRQYISEKGQTYTSMGNPTKHITNLS